MWNASCLGSPAVPFASNLTAALAALCRSHSHVATAFWVNVGAHLAVPCLAPREVSDDSASPSATASDDDSAYDPLKSVQRFVDEEGTAGAKGGNAASAVEAGARAPPALRRSSRCSAYAREVGPDIFPERGSRGLLRCGTCGRAWRRSGIARSSPTAVALERPGGRHRVALWLVHRQAAARAPAWVSARCSALLSVCGI